MSALGVHGDPGGWQHAGYTLSAAASQLTAELIAADAAGGTGLLPAWQGPMAESYLAAWRTRHGHYADLVHQVGRAASALIDFGERLADLQLRAARLETHWLGTGLHLTADGLRFTVPHGAAGLAHDVLTTLRGFEEEAASDVMAIWRDVTGAVADLLTILESVIDAVEDFHAIAYTGVHTALAWAFNALADELKHKPWDIPGEIVHRSLEAIEIRADHNLKVAQLLADKWSKDADPDVRAAAQSLLRDAEDAKPADGLIIGTKIGGAVLLAANVIHTVAEIKSTAGKQGWIGSIEDHSDDLASLASGVVIGAAATAALAGAIAASPILVPAGIAIGVGLVSIGIGQVVKHEVVTHRAATTRGLTQIGNGIKDAAVWTGDHTGLIAQPAD